VVSRKRRSRRKLLGQRQKPAAVTTHKHRRFKETLISIEPKGSGIIMTIGNQIYTWRASRTCMLA
jgi:hypothetical protein